MAPRSMVCWNHGFPKFVDAVSAAITVRMWCFSRFLSHHFRCKGAMTCRSEFYAVVALCLNYARTPPQSRPQHACPLPPAAAVTDCSRSSCIDRRIRSRRSSRARPRSGCAEAAATTAKATAAAAKSRSNVVFCVAGLVFCGAGAVFCLEGVVYFVAGVEFVWQCSSFMCLA